jgi:DNA-binding NarL/FixJ family response regulator
MIRIRLLVVDDHTSFRESLVFMLNLIEGISVVAEAGTLATARAALRCSPIDVALLDLDLAGEPGLDLIPDLRLVHPGAVALVLTGNTSARSRAMAVSAGAIGVVHKSASLQEITEAVRKAAAGESLISSREAATLMARGTSIRKDATEGQQALQRLSTRERDVLRTLATGLDNQGIAERLFISPETVRTHIVRIYGKLGVDSRLQAVLFAVRHGFLTEDELD